MGFFTSTTNATISSKRETIPVDDDYVAKTIRAPSVANPYENPEFTKHFDQVDSNKETVVVPVTDVKRKRFSFHGLFKRKTSKKVSVVFSPTSYDSNKENILPQPAVDEILSNEDEFSGFNTLKRGGPHEIEIYEDNVAQASANSVETPTPKRKSIRENLLSIMRRGAKEETPVSSPYPASSVYDGKETLTQRYMNNNYEKLMDDLDAIPFDFTIPEVTSTCSKLSKVVKAFSPKRNNATSANNDDTFDAVSANFKSTSQAEKCLETESWNPYDVAKKLNQSDAVSITSSEFSFNATKQTINVGDVKVEKPSRMATIARKFTIKLKFHRFRSHATTTTTATTDFETEVEEDTETSAGKVGFAVSDDTDHDAQDGGKIKRIPTKFEPLRASSSTVRSSSGTNPFFEVKTSTSQTSTTKTDVSGLILGPGYYAKMNGYGGNDEDDEDDEDCDANYSGSTAFNTSPEVSAILEEIYDPNILWMPKDMRKKNERLRAERERAKAEKAKAFKPHTPTIDDNFSNLLNKFQEQLNDPAYQRSISGYSQSTAAHVSDQSTKSPRSSHSSSSSCYSSNPQTSSAFSPSESTRTASLSDLFATTQHNLRMFQESTKSPESRASSYCSSPKSTSVCASSEPAEQPSMTDLLAKTQQNLRMFQESMQRQNSMRQGVTN